MHNVNEGVIIFERRILKWVFKKNNDNHTESFITTAKSDTDKQSAIPENRDE